jgi:cell division GTPase FtsZ
MEKKEKLIVALGGCGINIARALFGKTDAEFLFIGRKEELEGLGKFVTVDLGEKTGEKLSNREFSLGWKALREGLAGKEKVYILAGLGGATGSGLVSSAAGIARGNEEKAKPKLFLVYPFRAEEEMRGIADETLLKLTWYERHLWPNDTIAGLNSGVKPSIGYAMGVVVKAVLRELEEG